MREDFKQENIFTSINSARIYRGKKKTGHFNGKIRHIFFSDDFFRYVHTGNHYPRYILAEFIEDIILGLVKCIDRSKTINRQTRPSHRYILTHSNNYI